MRPRIYNDENRAYSSETGSPSNPLLDPTIGKWLANDEESEAGLSPLEILIMREERERTEDDQG